MILEIYPAKTNLPNRTTKKKTSLPKYFQPNIFNSTQPNSNNKIYPTRTNLPNQINATKPNLPKQTYQIELPKQTCLPKYSQPNIFNSTQLNSNNKIYPTRPNLSNQINATKPNLPKQTYQIKIFPGKPVFAMFLIVLLV